MQVCGKGFRKIIIFIFFLFMESQPKASQGIHGGRDNLELVQVFGKYFLETISAKKKIKQQNSEKVNL